MSTINSTQALALQYVKNTNGGATRYNFVEDHEPVGGWIWRQINAAGFVMVKDDRIYLTSAGEAALQGFEP